jgi:hypothetical protein
VTRFQKAFIIATMSLLYACGGGGGGGSSENYAGDVFLDLESDHIDSGDLNKISIEVTDINPEGSVLKIRMSRSLRYVKSSAVMFPDREEEMRVSPSEEASTDYERYLVFFLSPEDALGGDYISLNFTVKAVSGDEDGYIEVDLDNNDPSVSDSQEFKVSAPKFTAKQHRSIFIELDSSEPTPTPTPGGTVTATATPNSAGSS